MLRTSLTFVFFLALSLSSQGANIWLSSTGCLPLPEGCVEGTGSTPPETLGELQTITHQPSDTQGTFYVWARPTAGKTLQDWGLKVVASNPNVVSLSSSSVEPYNPDLGNNGTPNVRWEFVGEPTGSSIKTMGMVGLNVFGMDRSGLGIGPATASIDAFYHSATNAWLLAKVDYSLTGALGQSEIYLQFGAIGMKHAEDTSCAPGQVVGCESQLTNVVFGLTSDPSLNAKDDRFLLDQFGEKIEDPDAAPGTGLYLGKSSATADLFISVSDVQAPNADFDGDGDINGRDFLAWQRGFGITLGATLQQGDANFDGAVNAADLGFWHTQYGQSPPFAAISTQVPEPSTVMQLVIIAGLMSFCLDARGREPRWRLCPCRSVRR